MSDTLLLFDRAMIGHDPGPGHPERPQRLDAIEAILTAAPISRTVVESPGEAPDTAIARVHGEGHLAAIRRHRDDYAQIDGDTRMSPGSYRAALLAAGAAVEAVDAVCNDEAQGAFALVRPPGHHAEAQRSMGFCLFNNVAIAAAHARAAHGLERILVIDWDVHHGNGTQQIFYEDPGVLFFSSHQYPFYPGTGSRGETGRGAGLGHTMNVPLSHGAGDGELLLALTELVQPVAAVYRPQLVLVSAGFDAHRDDPLGGFNATDEGYADMCGVAKKIANEHAGGRLVLLLEGGYDLEALARSVHTCIQVLAGTAPPDAPSKPTRRGADEVDAAIRRQAEYWQF